MKKLLKKNQYQLGDFLDRFKTKRVCEKAVEDEPETLEYVPDHLKTEDISKDAVRREPYPLGHVPDHLKAKKMCEKVIEEDPWLYPVPDCFNTKRMC